MSLLDTYISQISATEPFAITGQIDSVKGLTARVIDLPLPIDSSVEILTSHGDPIPAQVIGFEGQYAMVMPLGTIQGIARGNLVRGKSISQRIVCSPFLIGRVIDALGRPMDGKGPIKLPEYRPINVRSMDCMQPASPSTNPSAPAFAAWMACSPADWASAWASSPAPAWANPPSCP